MISRMKIIGAGATLGIIGLFSIPPTDNNSAQASTETLPETPPAVSETAVPAIDSIGAAGCTVMILTAGEVFKARQDRDNIVGLDVGMGSLAGTHIEFDRNEKTLLMSTANGAEKHKVGIGITNMFKTSLVGGEPMQCRLNMEPLTNVYKLQCGSEFANASEIILKDNGAALIVPTVTATTEEWVTQYNCAIAVALPEVGSEHRYALNLQ